jgi:hypothetical protein
MNLDARLYSLHAARFIIAIKMVDAGSTAQSPNVMRHFSTKYTFLLER